ncbi:sulfatase family protein [Alienimonas californiensis]|uniref:Arylsulfatase n=1 Tax=Alienimonas californiensis TaxID=2527989 RepID=A0A517P9Z8_9PLAN|nr:sulfatase [Alienimonas californiensis]QDT16206.1 Arylsulfatase [Alienimonas californiensis]
MIRSLTLCCLALGVQDAVFAGAGAGSPAAGTPNVLWVMSDDHAAHAIGAYGGRLAGLDPTPHLDRFAAEGVRFTNAFCENSICVPSRATLLTGQRSHRHGLRTLVGELPAERQTLARLMGEAGYETAMIGKWHLQAEPAAFDHYVVLPGQGQYHNPTFRVRGPKPWPQNVFQFNRYDGIHVSDAVTELSLKWLENRKSDKPFFLMHHFKAPHDDFQNAERYDFLYEDAEIPEPPSLRNREGFGPLGRQPYGTSVGSRNVRRNMGMHMFVDQDLPPEPYTRESYRRYLTKYLRCVRGVDDNFAKLIAHLRQTGELENTLIVYTSDQGFMLGEHDLIDKRWIYEESLRIPLLVRLPESLRTAFPDAPTPGATQDAFVGNVDFAPTLLEFAGVPTPDSMDGTSFAPLLRGETQERPAEAYYRYWMHMTHHDVPAHYGVRTPEAKLVFFYGLPLDARGALPEPTEPHWELYDLRTDPEEQHNVIADAEYAPLARTLRNRLNALRRDAGDTDAAHPDVARRAAASWPIPE